MDEMANERTGAAEGTGKRPWQTPRIVEASIAKETTGKPADILEVGSTYKNPS